MRTGPERRDRLQPGDTPWPRLSETLPGERSPDHCQACGRHRSVLEAAGIALRVWREDGQDELYLAAHRHDPVENEFVLICDECNAPKILPPRGRRKLLTMIDVQPRHYELMTPFLPFAGIMPLCSDCRHRKGLYCACPARKINGGPGMNITHGGVKRVHLNFGDRQRSGVYDLHLGPARHCTGREPREDNNA